MIKSIPLIFLILLTVSSFTFSQHKEIMPPKREFRGVWVASVTNIDWPSRPGLSVDQQKQELIGILEKHKQMGLNAIMLQIRPTADALYAKS